MGFILLRLLSGGLMQPDNSTMAVNKVRRRAGETSFFAEVVSMMFKIHPFNVPYRMVLL